MMGVYQIIAAEDGRRSKEIIMESKALYEKLKEKLDEINQDDFVLLLMTFEEGQAPNITTAPLITIRHYMEMHEIEWADTEKPEFSPEQKYYKETQNG